MNTIISPNIKKTSERIDPDGNVINPRTKQIIETAEPEFTPSTPIENIQPNGIPVYSEKKTSKIDDLISQKIEAIINKKIEEALSKL